MSLPDFKREGLYDGEEALRFLLRWQLKLKYDLKFKDKEYELYDSRKVTIQDLASLTNTLMNSRLYL